MRPRDVLLAAMPPMLWAVAYTMAKPAMDRFPPLFLMSLVYAVTAVALYRPWQCSQTALWPVIAAATLGASLQSALIFSGIARVSATLAILTVQSQVPFAVLAAWLAGQEQTNARRLAGIVVALAGVTLVVGLPNSVGETRGLLMIVLGTLCWGVAQAIIRVKSRDSGARLMGMMAAIAAPQLLIMSLVLERGQQRALLQATLSEWGAVAVLALGGFVAAYSIWYGLLGRNRVDQIAPFILLMPIFGVLTAHAFLGEAITAPVVAGGIIILVGLIFVVSAPSAGMKVTTQPLPSDGGSG